MADLIDRQQALDCFCDWIDRYGNEHTADEDAVYQRIAELPAAQPEIIRCKDCKHWRDDHTCHEHSLVSPMCANEYCSRAERRTDERFDRQTGGD